MINYDQLTENFTMVSAMTLDFHDQAMDGISQDALDADRWRARLKGGAGLYDTAQFKTRVNSQVAFLIKSVENADSQILKTGASQVG